MKISTHTHSEVDKLTMRYTTNADYDLRVTPHSEVMKNEPKRMRKKTLPQSTVDIMKQTLYCALEKDGLTHYIIIEVVAVIQPMITRSGALTIHTAYAVSVGGFILVRHRDGHETTDHLVS